MTVFMQRLFAVMLLVLAASQASASTYGYNLTFKDEGGAVVGSGVVRYDPEIKEDVHHTYGERCFNYSDPFCEYFDTWTPLTEFSAVIADTDIFVAGSDTELWLEGHHRFHGRYGTGGYEPGIWVVGDIYDNETWFQTASPPPGAKFFETDYSFTREYWTEAPLYVSGKVEMSLVPVPPALASLGLGLLVLGGWRRLKAR
ncbi:MAG: hypothetical protein QNJ03_09025 [Dinoroseobacter sp.]|nr:hypothetical protein [Dinoroseobacter sp.]